MREQILRACYVKDVKKFIKDNTEVEIDLMKEFDIATGKI